MTQKKKPNQAASDPLDITVGREVFGQLQDDSFQIYEKPVERLSFSEAAHVVGRMLISATGEGETVRAEHAGLTVVDSSQDGGAYEGYARQTAAGILTEHEIILNVVLDPGSEDVHTVRFVNESQQSEPAA